MCFTQRNVISSGYIKHKERTDRNTIKCRLANYISSVQFLLEIGV